jgi:hypothetical protein
VIPPDEQVSTTDGEEEHGEWEPEHQCEWDADQQDDDEENRERGVSSHETEIDTPDT